MLVSRELRKSDYYYVVGGVVRHHLHWEVFLTPPPAPSTDALLQAPGASGTLGPLSVELLSSGVVIYLHVSLPRDTCCFYRLATMVYSSLYPQRPA